MKEHESVYAAFANNPVWFVDVLGNDTIDIEHNSESGKWNITNYQKVKGDDVFRLKIGDETKIYTFSEGEYGERVNALNLESNEDYTLGIYHISGSPEDKSGIGFYVTPGGEPSIEKNSKKRLPEGVYDIIKSPLGTKWRMPWVTSENADKNDIVKGRGIKFHPVYSSNPSKWTEGCFVLFYNYSINKNCQISLTKSAELASSQQAVSDFVCLLGAENLEFKRIQRHKLTRIEMTGAIFPSNRTYLGKLIIKSTWQ